jgi:hypothetical protein
MDSPVNSLYTYASSIISSLVRDNLIGDASFASMFFSKSLVLCCSSYFESVLTELIEYQVNIRKNECCPAYNFARSKGILKQYHSWFDWEAKNINKFLSLFGHDFKIAARNLIDRSERLRAAETSFMYIGALRNQLVHNNFASFSIDDSMDDVFRKFQEASELVEALKHVFQEYVGSLIENQT